MSGYQYTTDLIDDMLFRAGEPTDGSSELETSALRYLNRAYQMLWMGGGEFDPTINEDWWWLRKYPAGALIALPAVGHAALGPVSVTANSTTITFTSVPLTTDLTGWYVRVGTDLDVFRIATHVANQLTATLDGPYTGSTNATANFTAFKLSYQLAADVLRLISPMRLYHLPTRVRLDHAYEVVGMPLPILDTRFPVATLTAGIPTAFAPASETIVQLNTYPTAKLKIEYDYLFRPATLIRAHLEEPVVPLHWRYLLSDIGVFLLFLDKSDNRAEHVGQMAKAGVQAMALENRYKSLVTRTRSGLLIARNPMLEKGPSAARTTLGPSTAQVNA